MCTRGIAFYECQVSVMSNKTSYKNLMLCRIGWLMLSESILYPTRNLYFIPNKEFVNSEGCKSATVTCMKT